MSDQLRISTFKGPATATAVSTWFSECEGRFDYYEDMNATVIGDKRRIHEAAARIAEDHEMDSSSKGLKAWYDSEWKTLTSGTWDEFRDRIKEQLLGPKWRLELLKEFFTHTQNVDSMADYIKQFSALRYNISRSSSLPNIDDAVYNCLLLFKSNPDVYNQFVDHQLNEKQLLGATERELQELLRKYGDQACKVPPLYHSQMTESGVAYITSTLFSSTPATYSWGGTITGSFGSLPDDPRRLTRLTLVSVKSYNNKNLPSIQALHLTYHDRTSHYAGSNNHWSLSNDFHMDDENDFLESATFSRDITYGFVSYVRLETAKGQTFEVGSRRGETKTFSAPKGWSIVGFQGDCGRMHRLWNVNTYLNAKFGVIYGPRVCA
ncbi:hypothetical protein BDV38DRAFT_284462 [Aspergillus pseudotamarii]|uniref:Jacalin-type lectin domain-containing protein n=1 Tax=Aspergillus pseudotamarii TaxID=132259 RepID=A0A5N6SQ03_ASPPS|nr:uncharacterized protein BDV38DRAFT_284462 [Aspergillus pseudotamarii]KAE8135987.1 hypothetical protein BDV38DRAFT_284462 [Aspergillus pseudotamarii]